MKPTIVDFGIVAVNRANNKDKPFSVGFHRKHINICITWGSNL